MNFIRFFQVFYERIIFSKKTESDVIQNKNVCIMQTIGTKFLLFLMRNRFTPQEFPDTPDLLPAPDLLFVAGPELVGAAYVVRVLRHYDFCAKVGTCEVYYIFQIPGAAFLGIIYDIFGDFVVFCSDRGVMCKIIILYKVSGDNNPFFVNKLLVFITYSLSHKHSSLNFIVFVFF